MLLFLKEYVQFLASLCLINCKAVYEKRKIVPNQVIQVSITCSKHILYNLIFTTKVNDSSILITIISWNFLNLSLANKYVDDVTIPTQVIKHNQCCSRQISQSDCSIHIKLNYSKLLSKLDFYFSCHFKLFLCNGEIFLFISYTINNI